MRLGRQHIPGRRACKWPRPVSEFDVAETHHRGSPYLNASSFLRAIHIVALPGQAVRPYDRRPGERHSLRTEADRLLPRGCHRGPIVDESFRKPELRVQAVAAAVLHMEPADRRRFIRPLIALIERVASESNGTISVPSTPANRDLRPVSVHVLPRPDSIRDAALEFAPP
jgi:hypothetical protein